MDEIITRWATDLTKYQKEFQAQAEQVATWDQILVENMAKISKLYVATATAEKQTSSVEMQLTAVENQQDELSSWLDRYEKEVDDMMGKGIGGDGALQGVDQERERTYATFLLRFGGVANANLVLGINLPRSSQIDSKTWART